MRKENDTLALRFAQKDAGPIREWTAAVGTTYYCVVTISE